jgi:hypothetical protein
MKVTDISGLAISMDEIDLNMYVLRPDKKVAEELFEV